MKNRLLLIAGIAFASFGTPTVWAATTYSQLSGGANDLVLTATVTSSQLGLSNATVLFNGQSSLSLAIVNGSMTLDSPSETPSLGALRSFLFPLADANGIGLSAISTSPVALGSITATNMSISSSVLTPFSSVTGPQYSFSNNSTTDAGHYVFTPTVGAGTSGNFSQVAALSGTVTQASNPTISLAQLTGIQIASFGIGPGGSSGQVNLYLQSSATAKQDIVFTGFAVPVPLPGAVWLLGSGLGLFGMLRRRQIGGLRPSAAVDL